jgi:hypothetical protein
MKRRFGQTKLGAGAGGKALATVAALAEQLGFASSKLPSLQNWIRVSAKL